MSSSLLPYRPSSAALAPLVRRDDVGPLAGAGMLRDGVLRPLWHGVAVREGVEVTPGLRLAAVAHLVPERAVVARAAAAWVFAGGPPPAFVDVLVRPGARRTDPPPERRPCEGPLSPDDVLVCGAGRVTTLQRTGLDVARYVPAETARSLLAMLEHRGFDADLALESLGALTGERGTQRARTLLEELRRE